MTITLNGSPHVLDKPNANILELLKTNGVLKPELVSVQVNGEFVFRENFESFLVREGDEVDYLYFMGGGQINCISNLN